MKRLDLYKTVLTITGTLLSFNSVAEIYTWTDKNGKVHFSDKVKTDESFTKITPKENNNIANPFNNDTQWQRDYNKTKEEKIKQAEEKAKLAKKNKAYCDQVKRQLAKINYGGRIYVMSPEGERNFQSEQQLTSKKQKLTKAFKKNCK